MANVIFLRNLVPAYTALELALDAHRGSPIVETFVESRFCRVAALAGDLIRLEGDKWPSNPPVAAEAHAYAEVARKNPLGLVAHAYARYLIAISTIQSIVG